MITVQNYVNGTFVSTKETIEDINPATGEIIANIPRSKSDDVEKAVLAADNAREYWSSLSLDDRRVWLEKIANALEARSEEIATLEGHTRAVWCLTLHENKLYSGSVDETIRVWKI